MEREVEIEEDEEVREDGERRGVDHRLGVEEAREEVRRSGVEEVIGEDEEVVVVRRVDSHQEVDQVDSEVVEEVKRRGDEKSRSIVFGFIISYSLLCRCKSRFLFLLLYFTSPR